MPRLPHGKVIQTEDVQQARAALADGAAASPLAFAAAATPDLQDFDYLFPDLARRPNAQLKRDAATVAALKALGSTMVDQDALEGDVDSPIPAAYTYLGQFIDHDITLEVQSGSLTELLADAMEPLPLRDIRTGFRNGRTATLDLDSVYGAPAPLDPANPAKLLVGTVSALNGTSKPLLRPPGKGDDNDLPRDPRNTSDPERDRAARIGDARNDENTIISQLHVAFLKAHNALVDTGLTFEQARRSLRQHYQHIVVQDYLKRICDPAVVDDILTNGNRWFSGLTEPFFMPLEFTVAAFRFGHSMVRGGYNFNVNFNFADDFPATLELLFTFSAVSGQLGFGDTPDDGTDNLPDNWIIEWENILGDDDPGVQKARRLDSGLAKVGGLALFSLRKVDGTAEPDLAGMLAVRNLLRGYRLRMPTGQAVAEKLGLIPLTPQDILDEAASDEQRDALRAGGFHERTPLWYYVLAEAGHAGGAHLGPVGSTLVAEVLIGLARRSEDSILRTPGWVPSLPAKTPGRFTLEDLFRFAGVMATSAPPPRTHIVQPGDTLTGIAREQLGDESRWVELFVLNRHLIRDPDRIFPGQVLTLPGETPMQPRPRIVIVQPGDTLSGIAARELGDATRWPEIFALNGDVITNPDVIVAGQVLVLPPTQAAQPVVPPQGGATQSGTVGQRP